MAFSLNLSNDKVLCTQRFSVHDTQSIFEPLSSSFSSSTCIAPLSSSSSSLEIGDQAITSMKFREPISKNGRSNSKRKKCNRCDAIRNAEDSESIEQDEAIYAMIGNLWSIGLISDSVISEFDFPSNPI